MLPIFTSVDFVYAFEKYDAWRELGEYMGKHYPGSTIAVEGAGRIPYFSGLYTIDMLGLNDTHIAHMDTDYFRIPGHSKFDPEYVLGRRPDFIIAFCENGTDLQWGIEEKLYRDYGYRMAYLVCLQPFPSERGTIIDVRGAPVSEREAIIREREQLGEHLMTGVIEHIDALDINPSQAPPKNGQPSHGAD